MIKKDNKKNDVGICLNMILQENEPVKMVKRAIESVEKYVDGIYITITYNGEKPLKNSSLITFLKGRNANISFFKWVDSFAKARNYAMKQVPSDYFYIFWLDADDILQRGEHLKQIAREAYLQNISAVYFIYWYKVDLDKNGKVREVVIEHKRERLIRNDGTYKWIGCLHETLIPQRKENVSQVYRPECIIVHLSDEGRENVNLKRNIHILEKTAKEEKHKDPRTILYLAKAYYDKGKFKKGKERKPWFDLAKILLMEYTEGEGKPGQEGYQEASGWAEERATAWSYLADMFRMEGKYNSAIDAIFNAIRKDPNFPRYYLDLAITCTLKQEWGKAERWLRIALTTPMPQTTCIVNPRDMKTQALEIDFNIAMAKQDLDRALKAAEKLAEIIPDTKGVYERVEMIKSLKGTNMACQSIVYLAKYLEAVKEPQKIIPLIQSVPRDVAGEKFVSEMRHRYLPSKAWGKNEIAILCGRGFEKWSPKNLKKGLGGSESAVIYMSRELKKLGYKITVFGDPQDEAGDYNGVSYRSWHEINVKDKFNILILWRAIGFADENFSAKQTYLWAHDVPNCADYSPKRLDKIDKIIPLSQYHKSLFKMYKGGKFVEIPEEKFFVSKNGILPVAINKKWKREPHSMIWTSSYDRGLPYLLNMWSNVKKEVPDAILHIYYGWNLYDFAHKGNPARMEWKMKVSKMMEQDGIVYHGRVGHTELRKAYAKAEIFSYPTDFTEIFCISSAEAQAYGAIPVCTDFAALKETVKYGKKVKCEITTKEGQEIYKKELIRALKDHKWQEEVRGPMMVWASEHFLWEGVAKQWDKEFKGGVK